MNKCELDLVMELKAERKRYWATNNSPPMVDYIEKLDLDFFMTRMYIKAALKTYRKGTFTKPSDYMNSDFVDEVWRTMR